MRITFFLVSLGWAGFRSSWWLLEKPTWAMGVAMSRAETSEDNCSERCISIPNSSLCSPLHVGLHPTYPREIWSLDGGVKSQSSRRAFTRASCGQQSCRGIPCVIFFLFSKAVFLISESIWSSSQLFQSLFPLLCITQHTSKCGASLVGGFSTAKCNDEPWGGPAFCLI